MADVNQKKPDSGKKAVEPTAKHIAVKPAKEKRSFMARMSKFIRDYRSEIKKIVWPSFKQTVSNTKIVVISIISVGLAVGLLDFIFSKGILLLGNLVRG